MDRAGFVNFPGAFEAIRVGEFDSVPLLVSEVEVVRAEGVLDPVGGAQQGRAIHVLMRTAALDGYDWWSMIGVRLIAGAISPGRGNAFPSMLVALGRAIAVDGLSRR